MKVVRFLETHEITQDILRWKHLEEKLVSGQNQQHTTSRKQCGKQAPFYSQSSIHREGEPLNVLSGFTYKSSYKLATDIATGTEFTAFEIAKFSYSVIAADITLAMLAEVINICVERDINNVGFSLLAAEHLPFKSQSVDLVTCRTASHHFRVLPKAVKEWYRILKPGGTIIMVNTTAPEDQGLANWMNDVELQRDPSHINNLSPTGWTTILEKEGFQIQETSMCSIPLEFEDWVIRSGTPERHAAQLREDFNHAHQRINDAFDIQYNEANQLLFRWLAFEVKANRTYLFLYI